MNMPSDEKPFWHNILSQDNTRRIELSLAAVVSIAMVGLIVVVNNLSNTQSHTQLERVEIIPVAVLPDFASIKDTTVKKQQFFDFFEDYVVAEIESIKETRNKLSHIVDLSYRGINFSDPERAWLFDLASKYRIKTEMLSEREILDELTLRVDVLPVSLVLAQAANESAWGTSRFALQGYNIFGQWCYKEGCGIVPARRAAGASHEVKSFDSIAGSISAYFLNINTHPSYSYLRELRSRMRDRDLPFDSLPLTIGLGKYSERGDNYVDEVQVIILQNNLRKRDRKLKV